MEMKNSKRNEKLQNVGESVVGGRIPELKKRSTKDIHDRDDIFEGACVSGYHIVVCGCVFRKGGKTFNAHASTWASIRAVHATLSLSFVTHTYENSGALLRRTHVYSEMRQHFAFVMLVEARFDGWINSVYPGDILLKLHIHVVLYIT